MEDSMMDDVLADDASNTQDQDWSQWMQWDWNDSTPEPGPRSSVNSSDSSPQLIAASDSTNGKSIHAFDTFFCAPVVSNNNTFPNLRPLRVHPDSQLSASSAQLNNFEVDKVYRNAGQKRKSTSEDDSIFIEADYDSPAEPKPHPSKKRSHNVVEKRYRANLNDKITELRDSIPSLRSLVRDTNGGKGTTNDDDASPFGAKLNKASILSKATEYIRHLEMRNNRLEEENTALKTRLRQLEKAAIVEQSASISIASASSPDSYSGTIDSIESPPSIFSHTEEPSSSQKRLSSDHHPPEGLIKVPDYIKKMRASNPTQGAFAESYIKSDPIPSSEHNTQTRRGMTSSSKLFLGTIAGLMIMQNVSTEKSSDSDKKGLLAVPLRFVHSSLLSQLGSSQPSFLHWTQNPVPWSAWQLRAILSLMLTAGLAVGSAFLVFLYLFYARPKYDNDSPKGPSVIDARMTPAEIKRQAWLTSMQRLGVPQHRFFLEFFAVTSRWVEYTMCCIIGRRLYSSLTGITAEDEKGRIKTWDIAIDAQLAGGDGEVSKSRLVLTIFAAGTLPRTPARIMLKAFHCRVLLWRVGRPGSLVSKVANNVGRILATYQWNMARELNRSLAKDHPDVLPSHLAALVDQECNDVLLDPIVQRAVNLTWSRPTQEGLEEDEALLDVVAEDPAIQTFADAIAGWWSSHLLQIALLQSFDRDTSGLSEKGLEKQLNLAVQVAPRLSAAHTRAAAMRAVIVENSRLYDIKTVLNALPTKASCEQAQKQQQVSNFLDSSLPASVRNELAISARCAMIAAIIKARTTNDASFPSHLTIRKAITWLNQIPLDPLELTLISFAAVYHLLHAVVAYGDLLSSSSSSASSSSTSLATSELSISSSTSTPAPPPASIAGIDPSSSPLSSSPLSRGRLRSDSASEPSPQYNRIAKDLVYWARNAYNPAFYGLTSSMIDTVEAECESICTAANLGSLASQDSEAVETSIRKLIKREARKQKHRRTKERTPDALYEQSNEQVVESKELC